jgi:putative nucleotidyltransferase with HDIG domain
MITGELVRQRVKTLPSLPTTILSLGQAVEDDRCTVDRILAILSKDPAISATMLRMANSAMYSGNRVNDLRTAVMRLGFDAILMLGRTAAIIRSFKTCAHLDPVALWQHSVAVGLTAKGLCRAVGRAPVGETAFLAGLLHDIGKIALDRCFSEAYSPVVTAVEDGETPLDAELRLLGVTHAEVGALVAEQWSFPEPLVHIIRDHHAPPPGAFATHLIHLCDLLVRSRIPSCPADEHLLFALEEHPSFREVFGKVLDDEDLDLERITFAIDDELEHAIAFVQLAFQD